MLVFQNSNKAFLCGTFQAKIEKEQCMSCINTNVHSYLIFVLIDYKLFSGHAIESVYILQMQGKLY